MRGATIPSLHERTSMPSRLGALVCVAFLFSATGSASAATISLSSADDLQSLAVGTPVTISVSISGIGPGQSLTLLGATVGFDGSVFSIPSIAPGPIVPDPLSDPFDFLSSSDLGLADASFLTFSTSPLEQISADGEFYSFTVMPQQEGNGTFELLFVDAGAFDPENPDVPAYIDIAAGAPLSFEVVTVPEPSTAVMSFLGMLVLTGFYWRQVIRRQVASA